MCLKPFLTKLICLVFILIQLTSCQPLTNEEDEVHVNNRLRYHLKRIELVAQKANNEFYAELQNLMEKFRHSLEKDTYKEKSLLLEQHTKNLELADFLNTEFDKQYLNEDILLESWYLNEVLPYVGKDLYEEVLQVIHDLKEAYRSEDYESKLNMFSDIGENLSENLLNYFYSEDEPVLNAQLKYYLEYLQYLLNDQTTLSGIFKNEIRELLIKVEAAKASDNKAEKEKVIDVFDDLSTKFGRYLDEHFMDFNMFKFGE